MTAFVTEHGEIRFPDAINGSPEISFAQIANTVLRDDSISHKARGILCALLSNRDGWKSYKKMLQSGCNKGASVNSGLQELERAGYLWRVQCVNKRTKQRAGSFWSYTQIPWQHNIKKHEKELGDKGFEIWSGSFKQIAELFEIGGEKPEVENLNMAFRDIENQPLKTPTFKNTKNKEKTTLCSGGEKDGVIPKKETESPIQYEDIKDAWNIITANTKIKAVTKMTDSRQKHIKARSKDFPTLSHWKRLFRKIIKYPFLCGESDDSNWIITFDWIIANDNNPTKVLEGVYERGNKKSGGPKPASHIQAEPGKYAGVKTITFDNTKF